VTSDSYALKLNEGTIVLFPSHLNHSVEENLSNQNRYSIAFNFFVKGKFGKEEYQLELK
jgi:ectoine hydroxylase-related dioxygenase (phytanoyl-CoA dioxygenase family)